MPYSSGMYRIIVQCIYRCKYFLFQKITVLILSSFFIIGFYSFSNAQSTKWIGTWSTAPQLVEPGNNPPSPGLSNNTLRQIVHVSLGGDTLRIRFSNEFSSSPVTLNEVHIALSAGGDTINTNTDKALLFNGKKSVTMDPGSAVISDPIKFALKPLSNVAITIYFGATSSDVTGHPGSRTTSYLLRGNAVPDASLPGAVTTDHWYVINTIDVMAPDTAAAVAILGNSITDGRGSGTNKQDRWPDELARRFQANPTTQQVAVLNEGIGGNCVLGPCLGPSALSRLNRDVIKQHGLRWLVIFEGINDIGNSSGTSVGDNLINAYSQMIHTAHSDGIFVYGATLTPIKGSFYYSDQHEAEREKVNNWIRSSGAFDAVIDLDKAIRNPNDTLSILPKYDSGDHLHPSEEGHHQLAEAVDLSLFVGRDSLVYTDNSKTIYFEPECATVGTNWDILSDNNASNGKYVTVKSGIQSLNTAPTDSSDDIYIPFSVDSAGTYSVFARLNDPTYNDDSYWVKMDDGAFEMDNGLVTSGWEWRKFNDYTLSKGKHTLTIAYREDGAKLDKIAISNSPYAPTGMGAEAENLCTSTRVERPQKLPAKYTLAQNYPNPFNPTTSITYYLPQKSNVTLEVFDITGRKVKVLVDRTQAAGKYTVTFDGSGLSSGVYFYRLKTSNGYIQSKKMLLIK